MKNGHSSSPLRMFLWLTLLTGLFYPLLVTLAAGLILPKQASGDFVEVKGKVVGARLIAQSFKSDRYFWPRPSAVHYNPLPSGGSNLGTTSAALQKIVFERAKSFKDDPSHIPSELLYASGSGLDPHISALTAYYQVMRVAKARGMDSEEGREILIKLIQKQMHQRRLGFLGSPCINVLLLNVALDELNPKMNF